MPSARCPNQEPRVEAAAAELMPYRLQQTVRSDVGSKIHVGSFKACETAIYTRGSTQSCQKDVKQSST